MSIATQGVNVQVHQVAEYFAESLSEATPGQMPGIPDWLSAEAQQWIVSNHTDFSNLVVSAYREFREQRIN